MSLPLQRIEGKYEILSKLGEGGMGAIYKVRHRLLDEIRVVKVMRGDLAEDEGNRMRFLREARSAIKVRHPNIAQLYDFSVDEESTAYIVMEYIDGLTLEELLKRATPSVGLALEIAVHSLKALYYLHRKQLVHRDIAPDNLMLTQDIDGRPLVKLIDLGIAKSLESEHTLTEKGLFVGKMRYASPEQFGGPKGGGEIDARSDLYSFGIVFYELLTGMYPISGNDYKTLIAGHLFRPPLTFDESDPEGHVPEALRAAVFKALEKEPDDRFESAKAFSKVCREIQATWMADNEISSFEEAAFFRAVTERPDADRDRVGSTQDRLDYRFPAGEGSGTSETEATQLRVSDGAPTEILAGETKQVTAPGAAAAVPELLSDAYKLVLAKEYESARESLEQAKGLEPANTEIARLLAEVESALERKRQEAELAAQLEDRTRQIWTLLDADKVDEAEGLLAAAEQELGDSEALRTLRWRLETVVSRKRQARIEELVVEGRQRLAAGEHGLAESTLDQLHQLDAKGAEVEAFATEVAEARRLVAEDRRRRELLESLLDQARTAAAASRYEDALVHLDEAEALELSEEEIGILRTGFQTALEVRRQEEAAERALAELQERVEGHVAGGRIGDALHELDDQQLPPDSLERTMVQSLRAKVDGARRERVADVVAEAERLEAQGEPALALQALGGIRELDEATVEPIARRLQAAIDELQQRETTIRDLLATAEEHQQAGDHDAVIAAARSVLELEAGHVGATALVDAAQAAIEAAQAAERSRREAEEAERARQEAEAEAERREAARRKREAEEAERRREADEQAKLERQARATELIQISRDEMDSGRLGEAKKLAEQAQDLVPNDPEATQLMVAIEARQAEPAPSEAAPTVIVERPSSPVEPSLVSEAEAPPAGPAFEPLAPSRTEPSAVPAARSPWIWVAVVGGVVAAVVLLFMLRGGSTPDQVGDVVEEPTPVSVTAGVPVRVDAAPWAEVTSVTGSDGEAIELPGEPFTPIALDLDPGRYTIALSHPRHGEQTCEVEVVAGQAANCFLDLAGVDDAFVDGYFERAGWEVTP